MNNHSKEYIMSELENVRGQLLGLVNTKIDTLIARIESGETIDENDAPCEVVYPLYIEPYHFKGAKPAAVLFGAERVEVKTWRDVCKEIMSRCIADNDKFADLLYLRNKIHGRKRTLLADTPDDMTRPLKLAEELYFESHFDTEWLIGILTREILDTIRFDYSDISIALKSNRG